MQIPAERVKSTLTDEQLKEIVYQEIFAVDEYDLGKFDAVHYV